MRKTRLSVVVLVIAVLSGWLVSANRPTLAATRRHHPVASTATKARSGASHAPAHGSAHATYHARSRHGTSHATARSSSRSSRSASRSSRKSKKSVPAGHTTRKGRHSKASTARSRHEPQEEPKAPPQTAAQEPQSLGQPESPSLNKAYALYDSGANERLAGNAGLAVARLTEARQVIRQVRPDSDLESHIDYELGQALEQAGNLSEAEHIYIECLKVKRNFSDAAIHLSLLLVKKGQPVEALRRAREAVELNPSDPRAHIVLAVMLDKNGMADEATAERRKANDLQNGW